MNEVLLSVREMESSDIPLIIDYWLQSEPDFLVGMGVDLSKLPGKTEWENMLTEQLKAPYETKNSFCLVWLYDYLPVGHSNVNKIIFGEEAYMHLHIWKKEFRARGIGLQLVKLGLPIFFEKLKLKKIYCEPNAGNPAPNKTLEKAGFTFLKEYTTTPGWINYEQKVKRWVITADQI